MNKLNYKNGLIRTWTVLTIIWIVYIFVIMTDDFNSTENAYNDIPCKNSISKAIDKYKETYLLSPKNSSDKSYYIDEFIFFEPAAIKSIATVNSEKYSIIFKKADLEKTYDNLISRRAPKSSGQIEFPNISINTPSSEVEHLVIKEKFNNEYREDLIKKLKIKNILIGASIAFGGPIILLVGIVSISHIMKWIIKGFIVTD